jgi:hypothetical protein
MGMKGRETTIGTALRVIGCDGQAIDCMSRECAYPGLVVDRFACCELCVR